MKRPKGLQMYGHKWTPALLVMLVCATPTVSNAQGASGASPQTVSSGAGVVEVLVRPKGVKRREGECDIKIRLVSGKASFRVSPTVVYQLTDPGAVLCVTDGKGTTSTSAESILPSDVAEGTLPPESVSPPLPPTGGVTPPTQPPPCVSPTTPNCQ